MNDKSYINELTARVKNPSPALPESFDDFIKDPLACWIENTFGLTREEESLRLKRATPKGIRGQNGAAKLLADHTGQEEEFCAEVIETTLLSGHNVIQPCTGFPVFAFRLHQFIGRGDKVYASLQEEDTRHITTKCQQFVPGQRDCSSAF